MDPRYARWIEKMLAAVNPQGACVGMTLSMKRDFPELTRVRGHFVDGVGKRYTHWWLVDPRGNIVDPTVTQFPYHTLGTYEPHEGPEPTGKCLNCGGYVYDGSNFCSVACGDELANEYNAYLRK